MGRKKRERKRLRQKLNLLLLIWLLIYVARPQQRGEVLGVGDESIVEPVATLEERETVQTNEVEKMIEKWAGEYGVSSEIMKRIAKCESGFAPSATNGTYGGVFQFSESTWTSTRILMTEDTDLELRFDAHESVKTAAWKMAREGFGAWQNCIN